MDRCYLSHAGNTDLRHHTGSSVKSAGIAPTDPTQSLSHNRATVEGLIPVFIQLAAGTFGGIVAGQSLRGYSLGVIFNAVAGTLGGGICALIVLAVEFLESDASQFPIVLTFGLMACGFVMGATIMCLGGSLNRRWRR